MSPLDFNQKFYEDSFSREEFLRRLDVASNSSYIKISMIPFGCTHDPVDFLNQRYIGKKYIELIRDIGDEIKLYKLTHSIGSGTAQNVVSGKFFIFKYDDLSNVYVAITFENSNFYHKELKPLFNALFPDFIFNFIKSDSLKKLIQEFSDRNDITDIEIKRASQKLRYQDDQSMSAVTWPNMQLEDAFRFIHENNGWFKSLKFNAKRHDSIVTEVSIDRQGRTRTDRQFLLVYDSFVRPSARMLIDNYRLFSNRSRRITENFSPRPLSIDYSNDVFNDVSVNKTFINVVSKLEKASVSVLHGNPYLQLSITDYIDGSSFDVWVLQSDQIIIVPQLKGTVAAIKRLINHIFDTFAEGDINNYEIAV